MNDTYSEYSVILHGVNIVTIFRIYSPFFFEDILLSQCVWIQMTSETVLRRNNFKIICI